MLRRFVSLGFALLLLSQSPLAAQDRLTVVELFTSQGCSSCPPADAFLGELAKRPDVLALSEHVDYWDYLGWKDPFASSENTQRQRAYARRLGLSYVYTPQMVVQGTGQIAGADREGVLALVARAKDLPLVPVDVNRTGEGAMVARLGSTTLPAAVDVLLVRFDPKHSTTVARGENGGRQVQNYNVVRGFTRLAMWNGEPTSLPVLAATQGVGETWAILLQQTDGGRILGAARFEVPAN
jgi:hypothetical protein